MATNLLVDLDQYRLTCPSTSFHHGDVFDAPKPLVYIVTVTKTFSRPGRSDKHGRRSSGAPGFMIVGPVAGKVDLARSLDPAYRVALYRRTGSDPFGEDYLLRVRERATGESKQCGIGVNLTANPNDLEGGLEILEAAVAKAFVLNELPSLVAEHVFVDPVAQLTGQAE
jgi:hypothetical protein